MSSRTRIEKPPFAVAAVIVAAWASLAAAAPAKPAAAPAAAPTGGPVGTLTGPVVLKHTPPEKAEREKELVLRANIVAAAGAYLPTLYYRPQGENRYYSLPMLLVPGALNIYAASVPGIFVTKDLEYYLESYDVLLHGPGTAGSQKQPIRVPVVDPEIPPSQVVVRSDPNEALLSVDGKPVGKTPWIGMLVPGSHELLLKKEGFLEAVSTLDVPEGRDLDTLRALPPAAETATFAVSSDPTGATVAIDGQVLGTTPVIAPSPDGQHTLTVEKQGFARAERTMLFSKERSMETSFNLTKLPPEPALAITSEPAGAKVVVDGKDLGKTPFIGVVPSGEHVLELKLEGRRNAQAQIIMPEDRDLDLRFTLEESKVQRTPLLAISSEPANADVFVDDQPAGKTPYINELPPGPHKIRLVADKFQPYEKKITMPETNDIEITLALTPVPPPPGPSKVAITAEPDDAAITIDGKPAGKGSASVDLTAGSHVVALKRDGYRSTEQRFNVLQGQGVQMKLALSAIPKGGGTTNPIVQVKTDPDGAVVTIDGKPTAKGTPFQAELPPGKHKLVVSKDGFKSREEAFELPNDKTYELRFGFNLEPTRKSVSLASATDLKKEAEKPKLPVVDPNEVTNKRKAPTAGTPSAAPVTDEATQKELLKQAELNRKMQRRALAAQRAVATPQFGPFILAGTGVTLAVVGALFGIGSMATANDIADPRVLVDRADLVDRHTREIQEAVGLSLGGVALAAAGAVWAGWPKDLNIDDLEAADKADKAPEKAGEKPAEKGPKAGSGGDEPGPRVGVSPTSGGALFTVGGRF